jgi:hypothetical protein
MAQSLLATDGYKFSMAEAGWPLRTETFYYSHRKGGPQVLPVDVPAFLRLLLPRPADDDYRYLAEHSYEMGPGFKAAIVQTDALEIRALPRGAKNEMTVRAVVTASGRIGLQRALFQERDRATVPRSGWTPSSGMIQFGRVAPPWGPPPFFQHFAAFSITSLVQSSNRKRTEKATFGQRRGNEVAITQELSGRSAGKRRART